MGLEDMMNPRYQRGEDEQADPFGITANPEHIVPPMDSMDGPDMGSMWESLKSSMGSMADGVSGMFTSNPPERGAPTTQPFAGLQESPTEDKHEPAEESKPLIAAIESGYADKKVIGPIEMVREGVRTNNNDMIEKGHRKLVDMLVGQRTFGERFQDAYYRQGEHQATAHKMAADVVMTEMLRPNNSPSAEEAVRLGLVNPNELRSDQVQASNSSRTIPQAGFQFDEMGDANMVPATVTDSTTGVDPKAFLSPFQHEEIKSRQHIKATSAPYKVAAAQVKSELDHERILTERAKRETELPAKVEAMKRLSGLRDMQSNLAQARIDWQKQLPGLRRELAGGNAPFELEAIKRVQSAIRTKQPIDKGDWFIASRWLTKGNPQFGMDFMGHAYNRFTGKKSEEGPVGTMGIQEPPSTADPEHKAVEEDIDNDMLHQFGQMLGGLVDGITGGGSKKSETSADTKKASSAKAPAVKLPTPKTPDEASRLKPGTRYLRPDGKEMVR